MAATLCIKSAGTGQAVQLMLTSNISIGVNCDFCDFYIGIFIGVRRAGLIILEVIDLLRFSPTNTVCKFYFPQRMEQMVQKNIQCIAVLWGKHLVNDRGQSRMTRLV